MTDAAASAARARRVGPRQGWAERGIRAAGCRVMTE
jgi:hypothetical protein